MSDELMKYKESNELYSKITSLITTKKAAVSKALNAAMIFLYWEIGETICLDVLNHTKADYGRGIIDEVSDKLTQEYGKGFKPDVRIPYDQILSGISQSGKSCDIVATIDLVAFC